MAWYDHGILRATCTTPRASIKGVEVATKTSRVPVPDDGTDPAWEVALLVPAQDQCPFLFPIKLME